MRVTRGIVATALILVAAAAQAKDGEGGIADLRIARANGDITAAWLIAPTTRYQHFVLGSQYEAGGLRLRVKGGGTVDLLLPDDAVFEDRTPRIADLDGDGRNEVILVKSRLAAGSSLAIIALAGGEAKIIAETAPIGKARRWLSPVAIADFLGNGRLQVALVRKPHLAGQLEFWSFAKGRLKLEGSLVKLSNHQIGSRHQGLGAALPRGQGGDLLIIPSFDFLSLKVISAIPAPHVVATYPLKDRVSGDISIRGDMVGVPLADGTVQKVQLAPR